MAQTVVAVPPDSRLVAFGNKAPLGLTTYPPFIKSTQSEPIYNLFYFSLIRFDPYGCAALGYSMKPEMSWDL